MLSIHQKNKVYSNKSLQELRISLKDDMPGVKSRTISKSNNQVIVSTHLVISVAGTP